VKDPLLLLGWIVAAYLLLVCVAVAIAGRLGFDIPERARALWARSTLSSRGNAKWSAGPAGLLSLVYLASAAVAFLVWLPLRETDLPNLVPFASTTAPGDVRQLAVAAILGWALVVLNVVVAKQLIEALLPTEHGAGDKERDRIRMGAAIGVLERVLVVVLTLSGGPVAIGFVVAAKTLARFKKLEEDRDFAERYLLGTLASVTIALISALAAQLIWLRVV
jgi:hypothetical protein